MAIIRGIDQAWGLLLWLLMALAAIYIGLMMVDVVYITVFRTFDWDYTRFSRPFIEYGFIYILFLGSPWLIRHRGHVYIELLTAAVPDRVRGPLSRGIALFAAATCLVWAWYTWLYFEEHFQDNMAFDELRSDLPLRKWFTTIAFPLGFGLMAIEFLRFVFVAKTMHSGEAGVASERAELEEQKRTIEEGR